MLVNSHTLQICLSLPVAIDSGSLISICELGFDGLGSTTRRPDKATKRQRISLDESFTPKLHLKAHTRCSRDKICGTTLSNEIDGLKSSDAPLYQVSTVHYRRDYGVARAIDFPSPRALRQTDDRLWE